MRFVLYSLLLLGSIVGALPRTAAADGVDCRDCLLGIFDDPGMTRTTGHISAFVPKMIYLGMRLPAGSPDVASLEFDATYPSGFNVLGVTTYIPRASYEQTHPGGVQVVWPHCVAGTQLLFQVQVLTFRNVRDATVQLSQVVLHSCDASVPARHIPGGCYAVNPSGPVSGCAVAIESSTWGQVKELFK